MKIVTLLITLLAISSELAAEQTRYIRDVLWVPLRSGQSNQHRIVHKGLISGTAVTVIQTNQDDTYSLVRTRGGNEGWIETQYLSDQPAGKDLLKQANKSIAQLQKQNRELQTQLANARNEQQKTSRQLKSTSSDFSKTQQELENIKNISARSIQLNDDNSRLLNENQMLKKQVNVLTTDNQQLNDSKDNESFLNGALAVVIGVMLALIVPRLTPKKRTEWN